MSDWLPSKPPCSLLCLQCFYVPRCQKDSVAMHAMIMNISERLKVNQQVSCYYDPSEQQETVLLTRLYDHSVVFHSLLWPSGMLTGGTLIIVMVKLTQYLSRLCEEIGKIKRWTNIQFIHTWYISDGHITWEGLFQLDDLALAFWRLWPDVCLRWRHSEQRPLTPQWGIKNKVNVP